MTLIERKDETIYDLDTYGIRTKDIIVHSPEPRNVTEEVEGQDGLIDLGTTLDARKITGIFKMTAEDSIDFALLRNEIFKIFDSRESFYLIDKREQGKRWEVKCVNMFQIPRKYIYGEFSIDFICFKGFAESIGTTLEPITFDSELWEIGQGLSLDETMYTHTTNIFQIYNAADGVVIDPRKLPLMITFKGPSSKLQIINHTTGDTWSCEGTTLSDDTIKLDGIRSTKNNLSIFRETNHGIITLAAGMNDFELIGTSGSFTISFDFRFYTL